MTDFTVKDETTIRDDILRTIRNGLIRRGVANPNVAEGSDYYVFATAFARELSVSQANAVIKADAAMPDTAEDTNINAWATDLGLSRRPASGSSGYVVITSSASTTIASGTQLIDGAGLRFQVPTGGTFASGSYVYITAIDTGAGTNHASGDSLRWVATPPFCDEKVTVGSAGLTNGTDTESDEELRVRVLAELANPSGSGNWQHIARLAEQSIGSVQKCFVYPAVQGGATFHAAVTASPTTSSKNRDVASATVSSVVAPYVQGQMPEHVASTITTVANVNADVAIALAIPDAPTASQPGAGGGWLDGTPWPSIDNSSTFRCTVTGVTSTTVFTVDAVTTPTAYVSRIAWLSPYTWTLYSAQVTAVSGSTGAWVITIDSPFVGITTGCYIWPQCSRQQDYVTALLTGFSLLGPGEKTSNASALIRGFRRPTPATAYPYALGQSLLRAVIDAGTEVATAQFLHRTDGTTTLTGSSGEVKPQVPGVITDPPKQFVPRHIGFYRLP